MTREQRIRGTDDAVASALLLTGYASDALLEVARTLVGPEHLARRGATVTADGLYRLDCVLTNSEVGR